MSSNSTNIDTIVLVSIDNLRSDCFLHESEQASTLERIWGIAPPNPPIFQELVSMGTYYPNCYVAAPYTTASHASLFTGCFPHQHGLREYFRNPFSVETPSIFQIFKEHSYSTIFSTDFPFLLGPTLGFTRGVDHYVACSDEDFFKAFDNCRDQRKLCFHHFGTVHNPFGLTSVDYDGEFFGEQVAKVSKLAGIGEDLQLPEEWPEADYSQKESELRLTYFAATDALYEAERYKDIMSLYVEGVNRFASLRFKQFWDGLNSRIDRERSLIIVTADHGEEYSERTFGHFNNVVEGTVRVPLLIIGPGFEPGNRVDSVVRSVDVAPSICSIAGVDGLANVDGMDLLAEDLDDNIAYGETWFGYTQKLQALMQSSKNVDRLKDPGSLAHTWKQYACNERDKLIVTHDLEKSESQYELFDMKGDPTDSASVLESLEDINQVPASLRVALRRRAKSLHESGPLIAESGEEIVKGLENSGYFRGKF